MSGGLFNFKEPSQRILKGSILDGFQSWTQIAHPLEVEDLEEWGVAPYRPDLPTIKAVPVPDAHPAKGYLGNRSHDAGVFSFKINEDRAVLRLNDYDAWRLGGAYEQKLGTFSSSRSRLSPSVPVDLEFFGLREFLAYQFEPGGKPIRLKHSLRSNLEKIRWFDLDTVAKFDEEGIVILFEFNLWPARFTQLCEGVHLEHGLCLGLHCERLEVHEGQRQAWIEQFGEGSVRIWDEYSKVRDTHPFPSWNDFVSFLDELLG